MKRNILVGKTKIVLTDIRTGEVKTYEDKNTFQNTVVADYMRPLGAYNNSPYANSTWAGQEMWRNLAGGLLLFRDAIDLTGGPVKYMPAGNEMVGNGAYGVVNNSTPTELGSYNSTESQTTGPDSVSMVYDFTSSQANGTIGCICLTTETGGYIGYGNKSGNNAAVIDPFRNQNSNALPGGVFNNQRFTASLASDGTLTVNRIPVEVSNGSIFDGKAAVETYTVTNTPGANGCGTPHHIGSGIFRIPLVMSTAWNGVYQVSNGATAYYITYDSVNKTATMSSFTNNSGHMIFMQQAYGAISCLFLPGNKISCPLCPDSYYYDPRSARMLIDMSDGSLIKYFEYGTMSETDPGNHSVCKASDDLYFCPFTRTVAGIYDPVNDTVRPINGGVISGYSYDSEIGAMTANESGRMAKNPLMLTTVNNLDSPVTKTANQTMKVTYTLTKVVV